MPDPTDVLVAGGGAMGLWSALKAAEAGLSVTLIDANTIGHGASGGLLGALFPWMPDRWNPKKQYQFDALVALPHEIARLEALTGLSANYRRLGRIIPLPKPHLRDIATRHSRDAETNWIAGEEHFHWNLRDDAPAGIAPESAAAGHVHDTLAARVEPRALVRLLKAALARMDNVRIIEHARLVSVDAARGAADLSPEATLTFSHLILAAGTQSFPLLETILPPLPKPLGQGVKGQAALLKADLAADTPVIFLDGLYIVPHEHGLAAIGSTSENTYENPHSTDTQLDDVITRARALLPALEDAEVVERWAGIRPKAIGRDPMIGPLPAHANIIAMTGGFKITFGVAHRLAQSALDAILGTDTAPLPPSFTLKGQLKSEFGL